MQETHINFGKYRLLLALVIAIDVSYGRQQYDIDVESLKLYKQEFATVLARFRKSPAYLKILTQKANQLDIDVSEMIIYIRHSYSQKMIEDIVKRFNISDVTTDCPSTTPPGFRRRYLEWWRRAENASTTSTVSPVKIMDEYFKEQSILTVKEKNEVKDMAFGQMQQIIDTLLKHLNNEVTGTFTKTPGGGGEDPYGQLLSSVQAVVEKQVTKAQDPGELETEANYRHSLNHDQLLQRVERLASKTPVQDWSQKLKKMLTELVGI